jgi:hypothetical protein
MPSATGIYGGGKLEAAMLEKGREYPLTIREVDLRTFDDGNKLELSFRETDKTFCLNQTNCRTIASQLGDDYSLWPGHRVTVYRTKVDFQGRSVDAIRIGDPPLPVRPPAASASAASVLTGGELERQQQSNSPPPAPPEYQQPPTNPGGFSEPADFPF